MAAQRLAILTVALLLAATSGVHADGRVDRTPKELPEALETYYGVHRDGPMQAELEATIADYYRLEGKARDDLGERFGKLADRGCTHAMYYYGLFTPEGVDSDAHTLKWWHKAADRGDTAALQALGNAYRFGNHGVGGRGQYEQAEQWFLRAAQQGSPHAMSALGSIHIRNKLDVNDPQMQAYIWRTLAIPRFPPSTQQSAYGWGSDHQYRELAQGIRDNRLAPRMSDEEVAEAEDRAQEWEEAHDFIRHMPKEAEATGAPLPVWYKAIEGPCDR